MDFPITLISAAIITFLHIGLAGAVGKVRAQYNILRGDGNNAVVCTYMRAHANLIESAPITLVLILLLESNAAVPSLWISGLAGAFVFARIFHPIGYIRAEGGNSSMRLTGAALTFLSMIGMVAVNFYYVL